VNQNNTYKKQNVFFIWTMSCLSIGIAASTNSLAQEKLSPKIAEAKIIDSHGKSLGTATFVETDAGVKIRLQASGLSPGTHGIHFHEKGKCEGPTFKSSGEHFRPQRKEHGLENPKGPHAGDLPNLKVEANGSADIEMLNDRVTLAKGKNSLLKSGGVSVIIHAKPDDQESNPSGESGDRIACGVVQSKKVNESAG
jgi:Cu-Zn family superoxide dismutase